MVINSGLQFSLWSGDVNRVSEPPLVLAPGKGALQRLVSDTVSQDELPCLIETVVSNVKAAVVIQCLQGRDAQTFIDVIDQVHVTSLYLHGVISSLILSEQALDSLDFSLRIRRKCVKRLYKICASRALIPRSLRFELPEDTMGAVQYHGGSADVLKRECGDRTVAVKALRPRPHLSLEDMRNVSHR